MRVRTPHRLLVPLIAIGALLALTAHVPSSRAAATRAPCTKRALAAGLNRGASKFPQGRVVTPFGCAGKYAYAAVIVDGNELAVVYRGRGRRWFTVDRAHACQGNKVPSAIYFDACEVS